MLVSSQRKYYFNNLSSRWCYDAGYLSPTNSTILILLLAATLDDLLESTIIFFFLFFGFCWGQQQQNKTGVASMVPTPFRKNLRKSLHEVLFIYRSARKYMVGQQ